MIRYAWMIGLIGCAGDTLELEGSWTDQFDGTHEITEEAWTMGVGGTFHILQYDNEAMVLIAHNDSANDFNPGLYSRMDWVTVESTLHFCQTAFDAATEDAALQTPRADDTDMQTGCGGFSWSVLR